MNLNILAPINQLGYGITSLNLVKSLNSEAYVSLWCIGQPQVTTQQDAEIIEQCIKRGQFTNFDAPCIKIWHQYDMAQFIGKGKRIGFPIFELETFNDLEKHHLKSLDQIFVCSEWAKEIIKDNINHSDVHVIPLGVDGAIFKPSEMPNSKTTRFFNCGKWEIRKGHDVLVNIFNAAFEKTDDVELFMMCDNPFYTKEEQDEWVNLYKQSKLGSKIHIIPRQASQEEVYNIMKEMHCGIFPARAEGWNLELLEMMSCGKPVITTNYAAHRQFCNESNAFLAPIQDLELAYDGKWFHAQGKWAKIDSEALEYMIDSMRLIHKKRLNNELTINHQGINTAQSLSWMNSAREILNVI